MTAKHILVHDRNAEVTITLRLMLESLGHLVSTAVSSADVMTALSRRQVDVVMTNSMHCNHYSGAGLPSLIRAVQPCTKIILTSCTHSDDRLGPAHARLPKPFSISALHSAIVAAVEATSS